MSLDRQLRRLLEKHANFQIPLGFGDPLTSATLSVGAVIDLGDADHDRPVIGHLEELGIAVPTPEPTGALDIGLSLSRKVGFKGKAGASAGAGKVGGHVELAADVKEGRDVVVLVEPMPGLTIERHLMKLASRVAAEVPSWDHRRHAFVARIYAVARGEVMIAREGGGSITLSGDADAISRAVGGELSAGVTWTKHNLFEKGFDEPGVFGVQLVKVTAKGAPQVL